MPDPAIDSVLNSRFDLIIDKVFDRSTDDGRTNMSIGCTDTPRPSACFVDRYMAHGNGVPILRVPRLIRWKVSVRWCI